MNYYISDLHFGHANVIRFDNRPFTDVDEMDRFLIDMWNARVRPEDNVYIVGDFSFRTGRTEEWYLEQLKGHKHLVVGNHDGKLMKNEKAMKYFESVNQILQISDEGRRVTMCHYPMAEWPGYYKNGWHIYGHIHNRRNEAYHIMKKMERAVNAACCINNYMPATLDELIRNNEVFKDQEGGGLV